MPGIVFGYRVSRTQSPKLTSRAIPVLPINWLLIPEFRSAIPNLSKGYSACLILVVSARLRATLSNYDSAEEAEGLERAQAEKMTAKLGGIRQMEVAVDCAR